MDNEKQKIDDIDFVQDDTENSDVQNSTQEAQNSDVQDETNKDDVISDVVQDLSEKEQVDAEEQSDEPKATEPVSIDFSKLTPEQINQLREMFEQTPRQKSQKDKYYTVRIKQIDGKFVVAWEQAFLALVDNEEERRKEYKQFIPVKFLGEDKYTDIPYFKFLDANNSVDCRVIDMKEETVDEEVGETYKRDESGGLTQQLVKMYVTKVKVTFKVELPDGQVIEIPDEFVNG